MTQTSPTMISKSTKIAIDVAILDRLEAIRPSYQTKKSYINMLLDQAVQKLETQQRQDTADWDQ
jgi:hypothetical protein